MSVTGESHCTYRSGETIFGDSNFYSFQNILLTHAPNQVPALLGATQNELGLRSWLESQGHTLVTTDDKEGENSTFDRELVDAEIIITTP